VVAHRTRAWCSKSIRSGNETVLHSFTGGADGGSPYVGVIAWPGRQALRDNRFRGATNAGVVFEIKP
jgi:hypothetical protein